MVAAVASTQQERMRSATRPDPRFLVALNRLQYTASAPMQL